MIVQNCEIRKRRKELDAKFPSWEDMDLWQQIKECFSIVKQLNNIGLNLNKNFTNDHAIE
jgi:hypothetical protein